jgi:hypothetical protein
MYSGYLGKRRSVEGMRVDPNESRMVLGRSEERGASSEETAAPPDVPATDLPTLMDEYGIDKILTKHIELLNCEYVQSFNHLLCGGPFAGQVAAMALFSDEGLVELDRMAGDESAYELDRLAAQILTHHPHSRVRLDRLRASANAAMQQAAEADSVQ